MSRPLESFPPYCPVESCDAHDEPFPGFCTRDGFYKPKCRAHRVQRYRCHACGKRFSRQTFRQDYRDHKPWLNQRVFELLSCGVGLRQMARQVRMTPRNLEMKVRKINEHLRLQHENLMGTFGPMSEFAFDELETFEGCRSTRPLTVPILIEQETTFLVDAQSDTIPPSGKMTKARRRRIAKDQARRGKRRNRSRQVCRRVLATLGRHCDAHTRPRFRTDKKLSYPGLIRERFGIDAPHLRVHSRRRRDPTNPLHRINLTLARARDLMGRLRRRSWLVTKDRRFLDLHLAAFMCYRNYTQSRFNKDDESPAQMLGFLPRKLTLGELLSWRQDHQDRSIHPLSGFV